MLLWYTPLIIALFEADHLLLTRQGSSKMSSAEERTKADLDNRSDQCNPNNSGYQGHTTGYSGTGTRPDLNSHANQLNPNNKEYRGPRAPRTPRDWWKMNMRVYTGLAENYLYTDLV